MAASTSYSLEEQGISWNSMNNINIMKCNEASWKNIEYLER